MVPSILIGDLKKLFYMSFDWNIQDGTVFPLLEVIYSVST